jgi:hypothetical protein
MSEAARTRRGRSHASSPGRKRPLQNAMAMTGEKLGSSGSRVARITRKSATVVMTAATETIGAIRLVDFGVIIVLFHREFKQGDPLREI